MRQKRLCKNDPNILYMLCRIPSGTLYSAHYKMLYVYDSPCIAYIFYVLYDVWCSRTALRCSHVRKTQRFDTTKLAFSTFDALEPSLLVVRVCNRYNSGSTVPIFLKQILSEIFGKWCYRIAVLRSERRSGSDSGTFSEATPFRNLVPSSSRSLPSCSENATARQHHEFFLI